MHGFTFSNELISRDEGLHYMFANLLYNKYLNVKLPKETAIQMIEEAFEIQKIFIKEMFQLDGEEYHLKGMNS